MVASAAKDQIQGTLTVKSVSLGWLSPVRLSDVALKILPENHLAR